MARTIHAAGKAGRRAESELARAVKLVAETAIFSAVVTIAATAAVQAAASALAAAL